MIASILVIIVCSLLVMVILIQNSKGGGIQSQYSAATQIMGVRKGTEFIEKATWGLAILLIVLSIGMASINHGKASADENAGSKVKEKAATAINVPQQQAPPVQQVPDQQGGQQAPAEQTPPNP